VLMSETMAAGPVGLAARDHAVDRLTALLEDRGEVDTPAPGAKRRTLAPAGGSSPLIGHPGGGGLDLDPRGIG